MLNEKLVGRILEKALSKGADFAEIFVEDTISSRISFNDSKAKQSIVGKDYGVGIRVFYDKTMIYAYTNDLSEKALMNAADAVSKASQGKNPLTVHDLCKQDINNIHPVEIDFTKVSKQEKIDYMRKIDLAARKVSEQIVQVDINMSEWKQKIMIANSAGLWKEDTRTYSRISANAIAASGSEKQSCSEGPGSMRGYEHFRMIDPQQLGYDVANVALIMLNADYSPSGKLPVVIDNGFGGVIFHEACGHALETTSVAKGASVFADQMGNQVAGTVLTAIDDGTIPYEWGSTNIDDEGEETRKTVLIENGILKSFIVDKMGSLKTGYAITGSGRRQSYKYAPTSRMRNTYIAAGKSKLSELIESIDYGIYAKRMGGGSVMPGTGNFNFAVNEGYIIRKGKIAEPVRGASLIGNGLEAIKKISMVADNLKMAQGMCGSISGNIPVNVGQPAIKIDEIIVGGRK